MWNIESTTRLMKAMSQASAPDELVGLFFDVVGRGQGVQRALVLQRTGLSPLEYQILHDISDGGESTRLNGRNCQLRQGGLLARILSAGRFQNIPHFVPDRSDPAFDLLRGSRSLMAFPLFDRGVIGGTVVLLGSSPPMHNSADLCALAMASSLLGRAIEIQKLADQLEVTCRALNGELQSAARVQRWLLPTLPEIDEVGISASYRPAGYAGGDYYDVGLTPDGKLGVLIADVSGRGTPAAVLMAVLRSIVHDELDRERLTSPAALLDYADARLGVLGLPEMNVFVTAFCATLDLHTGTLVYSCAGHNPPRLLRVRQRSVIPLDGAKTIPLGLLDERTMHLEESVQLEPGDLALLYTDGITEARSPNGELFGEERLDDILRRLPGTPAPQAAVQAITTSVAKFQEDAAAADDQTLLALGLNLLRRRCDGQIKPAVRRPGGLSEDTAASTAEANGSKTASAARFNCVLSNRGKQDAI